MSSIMKGLVSEGENVSVIYIDGKPAAKYVNKFEAEKDAKHIQTKFPNKKIEIKQEVRETELVHEQELDEDLRKWFKEKWVRFGPDGKIRGSCARGDDSEGKPKCLPQAKAHALGKKGRKYAASKKRREDPNPERRGPAKNVATKKKTNEADLDEACWKGYHKEGNKKMFGKTYPNCVKNEDVTEGWKEEAQDLEDWAKEVNMRLYRAHESQRPALARQLSKLEQKHFGSGFTHPNLTEIVWSALRALQKGEMVHYDPQRVGQMPFGNIVGDDAKIIAQYNITRDELAGYRMLHDKGMVDNLEQFLKLRRLVRAKSWPLEYYEELEKLSTEEAWLKMANDLNWSKDDMNEEVQSKTDDKLLAYYAQRKAEKEKQHSESCPHCGGEMVSEELMNEKKDACYYKVKSRYKVWPSAYASGALVKCRKKGADNWGNGGKKNESSIMKGIVDEASSPAQQAAIAISKKKKQGIDEAGYNPMDDERREQQYMDQSKRDFKRREHEAEWEREQELTRQREGGHWYIRINGKIFKDRNGDPVMFNGKKHANAVAIKMMQKPFNVGKEFMLTTRPEDKQQGVAEAQGDTLLDPEYSLPQARKITKAIKYDDTIGEIITQIQMLAERTEGIDSKTLEYSIDGVLAAKNALESAVYDLEEAFEDAARNAQYKRDEEELGEDTDMRYAAEKTPEINPYGGAKNRQFRGAISETPADPSVEAQAGGWRTIKTKPAGTFAEDTAYAGGMGQGHSGESYRKFKPKVAGTFKESSIMKGLKRESK